MILFCYIAYELLVGLAAATAQEKDLVIRGKIQTAQVMTVISWYCAETQPELLRQRYEATEPAAMMMIQETNQRITEAKSLSMTYSSGTATWTGP